MEEYDYEIVFKKGATNTNADALSRVNSLVADKEFTEERRQQITDKETKATILYEYQDSPVGGHRGMNKTSREIGEKYEWPNMNRDTENYVKKCQSCQVNKSSGPRPREPMDITTTARKPFKICALDTVGTTTVTNKGNRYSLAFQGDLTKFVVAEPIPTHDVEIVARKFVHNIFLKFGIPEVVVTDQGSNFLRELFQNTCKLVRINRIHITAFHLNLTVGSRGVIGPL